MASAAPVPGQGSAPLPPLPDLQSAAGTGGKALGQLDPMAAIVAGIAPVKTAVDSIVAAAKQIVQSGAVPGAEQPCSQIIALAVSLLPMAAQQAMQPGGQGIQAIGGQPPQGGQPGAGPQPGTPQPTQ